MAVIARGKPFTMANWEGAVVQHGQADGVRYRLADWLNDSKRLVMGGDAPGEEMLEVHPPKLAGPHLCFGVHRYFPSLKPPPQKT